MHSIVSARATLYRCTVSMHTIQNDGVVVIGLFTSLSMVSKIFCEPSGFLNNHIFLFLIYFMHGKFFISIDVGNNWLSIPKEHSSFLQHMHRVFSIPAGTVLLLLTLCWLLGSLRCDLTYFNIPSGHRPVQQHFIHTGSNTYSHGMYSSSDCRTLGFAVIHVTYLFTITKYWNSSDVIVCFCWVFLHFFLFTLQSPMVVLQVFVHTLNIFPVYFFLIIMNFIY